MVILGAAMYLAILFFSTRSQNQALQASLDKAGAILAECEKQEQQFNYAMEEGEKARARLIAISTLVGKRAFWQKSVALCLNSLPSGIKASEIRMGPVPPRRSSHAKTAGPMHAGKTARPFPLRSGFRVQIKCVLPAGKAPDREIERIRSVLRHLAGAERVELVDAGNIKLRGVVRSFLNISFSVRPREEEPSL